MYDGLQTLTAIDSNMFGILALCALAMVFNYVWFFSAYVIARREKVYSIPIFCTLFWFAGDATFVAHYDTWFNIYDHWYVELFWAALLFTVMFEVAYIVQAIQYARKELLPSSSPHQFAAMIVAGAIAAVIIWNFINHTMGDPLGIAYFCIANTALPLMHVGILMRRRSSAGTAPVVWWGYLGMITSWFAALVLFFGPEFRSFWYFAMWAVCTVGGDRQRLRWIFPDPVPGIAGTTTNASGTLKCESARLQCSYGAAANSGSVALFMQPAVGPVHDLIDCEGRGAAFGTQSPVPVE